jgi:hypothetical protein
MTGEELTPDERAELERLRTEATKQRGGRWARGGRWVASCALLLVAALLGTLAVVAVYLRSEVLDTDTYVQTVAPLSRDPAVQDAIAARLATEIVARSDVTNLANEAAERLEAQGAPARLSDLVGPLVNGLTSFLRDRIRDFLATERFQTAWDNLNRTAHDALVAVLTGEESDLITSQGTTVTVDLGELLSMAKERLVAEGLTIVERVPDVSIQYTLLQSDKLPDIRTYTQLLNTAGTWLPWVALVFLIAGIVVAPNRRRGIVVGAAMLGITVALLLGAMSFARDYYLDRLPPEVGSPDAVAAVYDAVVRFLISALQTLLVVTAILVVGALLAGPSRPAVAFRRLLNKGLNAGSAALTRAGGWVTTTGRALAAAYHPIQIGLVLLALVGFIVAERPSIGAALWVTFGVLVVLALLEILVRAGTRRPAMG